MKLQHFLLILIFISSASSLFGQKISADELDITIGSWTGEMTIYNFDTAKSETKTANLFIQRNNSRDLTMIYRYPSDSENVSQTYLRLKKAGKQIGKYPITYKHTDKKGNITIKTEGNGKIEWQKVKFYYTYIFGPQLIRIKREIHFLEQDIHIIANDFTFKRA